jgi:hypothetical protein
VADGGEVSLARGRGYASWERFGYARDITWTRVTGLIWVGGNTMKFKVPLLEVYFTLACGDCAVSILEALR